MLHHRNTDHLRAFALHHRTNQHPVNVLVNIDLVIIERFQDFRGHERLVNDISLDGRETDLRRIITERDQRHGFMQAVCCPLQLVDIVKGISAQNSLGLFDILGKLFKQFRGACEEPFHQLLFFLIQCTFFLLVLKVTQLAGNALRNMLQKPPTEKQVIHLDVDIQLRDVMPRRAQDRSQ